MKRRDVIRIISYSLSFCAVCLGAAIMGFSRARMYKMQSASSYMSAFTQLIGSVSKLNSNLEKSMYSGTSAMNAVLCAEIWKQSAEAKASLALLPIDGDEFEKTQKFIAQTGEYAYTLLKKTANGSAFDSTDRKNIKSLAETSGKLAIELSNVERSIKMGDRGFSKPVSLFSYSAKAKAADDIKGEQINSTNSGAAERETNVSDENSVKNSGNDSQTGANKTEGVKASGDGADENFPEYAALIYDGPFSEHIEKKIPAFINDKKELSQAQAANRACEILGIKADKLSVCDGGQGKIKTYCFSSGEKEIELTKKGGYIINYTDSSSAKGEKISAEQAIKNAKAFMDKCGFYSMSESYYIISGGIITINFAYKRDDIIYYTDLIKVSVFLNGGDIAALESYGYIMNHTERNLSDGIMPQDAIKKSVCAELDVLSVSLAVIPSAGENEILCYEFKTKSKDDRHCIVYINAQTGTEENILILLEDENGTLTI